MLIEAAKCARCGTFIRRWETWYDAAQNEHVFRVWPLPMPRARKEPKPKKVKPQMELPIEVADLFGRA